MQKSYTYAVWSLNRFTRGLIKAVMLFPLMAVTFIPAAIFDGLCRLSRKLDDWWWM